MISAPVAVIDPNRRDNFGQHVGSLGADIPKLASGDPASNKCESGRAKASGTCSR